ncbi:retrovirus-related pol polyprotein from transposon TNT 1-94 [Tanacetum coccineum]
MERSSEVINWRKPRVSVTTRSSTARVLNDLSAEEKERMTGNLSYTMNLNTSVKSKEKPFKDTMLGRGKLLVQDVRGEDLTPQNANNQGRPISRETMQDDMGTIARECPRPKRLQDSYITKTTKMLLMQAQESVQLLMKNSRCFMQENRYVQNSMKVLAYFTKVFPKNCLNKTGIVERRIEHCGSSTYNEDILEAPHVSMAEAVATANPLDLTFFRVFGALCYPTNDSENLGKFQAKADIGIFVGYAPSRKGYRIYNKRTRRLMETIHVTFDEMHQSMALQRRVIKNRSLNHDPLEQLNQGLPLQPIKS